MVRRMEGEGWEAIDETWTSLFSSYGRRGRYWETLRFYNVMRCKGVAASAESVSVVVSICDDCDVLNKVRELHGYVVTVGFEDYSFAKSSMLGMYGTHGALKAAEKLFSEIGEKSLVSWKALISTYAQAGLRDETFTAFFKLKNSEIYLVPNVVSWSAIISGFAANGRSNESFYLFRKMQLAKVKPNAVTISGLLSVCAHLSTIHFGKEVHAYIIRNLFDPNLLVDNGLINMYAKCGSLKDAHIEFKNIEAKDLCSYNTAIRGYGMHGHGEIALEIFKQMIRDGYDPDGVTFVSLLTACSHTGLVIEGRKLINQMRVWNEPEIEHYACMVDLFGRAGLVQEASEVAKRMPIDSNVCVWGALLKSSRMHKDIDWDEESVSKILYVSSASGNYLLLSDIYTQSGQWG